jgi:hypothetical protein
MTAHRVEHLADGIHFTGADPDEVWPLVRDYHYSRRMPSNIQHCFAARKAGGLFGDTGEIVAAVVFSIPGTKWSEEVVELSRLVRHPHYGGPLTSLLSFANGWMRRKGWCLLVSFADWTHKHHGGIYQAGGWLYHGMRPSANDGLIIDGIFKAGRSCNHAFGTRSVKKLKVMRPDVKIEAHYDEGKHLYWKALTVAGKSKARRLGLRSLPYPKPNAARPLDERGPPRASAVQPCGAAPL